MGISNWWAKHGGAVVAFAGASGVLIANTAPGLDAEIKPYIDMASTIVAIAGAVLHGYMRSADPVE